VDMDRLVGYWLAGM